MYCHYNSFPVYFSFQCTQLRFVQLFTKAFIIIIKLAKCCMSVCVCVWMLTMQGCTNRNRCTQRLVILHVQTY